MGSSTTFSSCSEREPTTSSRCTSALPSCGDKLSISSTMGRALQNEAVSGNHSNRIGDTVPTEGLQTEPTVQTSDNERARVIGQIMSITSLLKPLGDQEKPVRPEQPAASLIDPIVLGRHSNTSIPALLEYQKNLEGMMRAAVDKYSEETGISHLRPIYPTFSGNLIPIEKADVRASNQEAQRSPLPTGSNLSRRGRPLDIGEKSLQRHLLQSRSRAKPTNKLPGRSYTRYTVEERDFVRFHREELGLGWEKILAGFHAQWPVTKTLRSKAWCMSSVYYLVNKNILLRHDGPSPVSYRLVDSYPERVVAKRYSWMSNGWRQVAYKNLLGKAFERGKGEQFQLF